MLTQTYTYLFGNLLDTSGHRSGWTAGQPQAARLIAGGVSCEMYNKTYILSCCYFVTSITNKYDYIIGIKRYIISYICMSLIPLQPLGGERNATQSASRGSLVIQCWPDYKVANRLVWFGTELPSKFLRQHAHLSSNKREERRWLRHGKWLPPFFSFGCKTFKSPGAKAKQNTPSAHPRDSQQPRKYPRIQPRFYSPFWRNKPRHALSLRRESVGARKGCFFLFSLCSERDNEKNR